VGATGIRVLTSTCVTLAALATTGCTGTAVSEPIDKHPTCATLEAEVMDLIRLKVSSNEVAAAVTALPKTCKSARERIDAHLQSSRAAAAGACGLGADAESWELGLAEAAAGGECSNGVEATPAPPTWPQDGLGWDQAILSVGAVARVCGPLMSLRNTEWGAFLNLGEDYPSPDRFTVVVWDATLDPIDSGSLICAEGEITLYEGGAQIEVQNPSDIEVWNN